MSYKVLMELWSDLEEEAGKIIAARKKTAKDFGEENRYVLTIDETREVTKEVDEHGVKVRRKVTDKTGRRIPVLDKKVEDTARIFKNKGQMITAITVLDQQQLILSAALEQMLSNNGTRPVELALPDQKELELILKEKVPGVQERVKDWFKSGNGTLLATDAVAVASIWTAIVQHNQGKEGLALAAAGVGVVAEAVGIALSKNPHLAKFFKGEPGQSAKIVFTAPKAEGRVIRTYVDRLGTLGQANVAENILAIERLRADIFSRAGLDLQNAVNQAMLRLDLTSLDTGANTLSGGSGEILLYNRRQYYIREILQKEKHTDHLANLSPEEQLDVVLKAYDLAITEYCGDVVDNILKEHDEPAQVILETDSQRVEAYANKLASGALVEVSVKKEDVENAFKAKEMSERKLERLRGIMVRVQQLQKDLIPQAEVDLNKADAHFQVVLKIRNVSNSDYIVYLTASRDKRKSMKTELDDLMSKRKVLDGEKPTFDKKTNTGKKKEDIDKDKRGLDEQIMLKKAEIEDIGKEIDPIASAVEQLEIKKAALKSLEDELARHVADGSPLSAVSGNKDDRKNPDKLDQYDVDQQVELDRLTENYNRLKGIQEGTPESKKATAEDKLKATQLGYLAAVGLTTEVKVGERTFKGRYNDIPTAITTQQVTLSELSSRTERGFQLWQELEFGTLTPDTRQEVEGLLTMGEMAKEVAAFFGMDKHPSPRLAELLATNSSLYKQVEPLGIELARLKKAGSSGFTPYPSNHPLETKSYDDCVKHWETELKKFEGPVGNNEQELYFEVVPRLGIDRFETAQFARHLAKRLVDKAKTGNPTANAFNLSRFERPTAVREIGETYKSKFGTASVEENQVEGVRREYARYRFTAPQGFKADGVHDTPLDVDIVVGNPQTAGQPEYSLEFSMVLTPQWWDTLPLRRSQAIALGFPVELIKAVYESDDANSGKKAQKDIDEMNTVIVDKIPYGNNFDSVLNRLKTSKLLGGLASPDTNPASVESRLQELTYKSIGELLIHGDPNRTTKYFEKFRDLPYFINPTGGAGGSGERWIFTTSPRGFEAVNAISKERFALDDFFRNYEVIYRRTRGKMATDILSNAEKAEMDNEVEMMVAALGEKAITALAKAI